MVQRRHGKLDGSERVGVGRESAGREIRSGRLPASAVSVGCAVVVQPRRTEMDGSGRGDAGGAASAVSMRDAVLVVQPRRGNWTSPSLVHNRSHERSDPFVSEASRWCRE